MRIRTFTATTAPAAMALVRSEMGDAAVIIAVDQATNGHGVVIRAAVDEEADAGTSSSPPPVEDRLEALLKARLARPHALGRAA
jgi:flagellar biosynthesis GTPase FlhF